MMKVWAILAAVLALGIAATASQPAVQAILIEPLRREETGQLELTIDKGCGAVYEHGEELHVRVRSEKDGYLTLLNFQSDGTVLRLFPNRHHQDNFIQGGKENTIPGELLPFRYVVAPPDGRDILYAVVTETDREMTPRDFTEDFMELPGKPEEEARALSQGLKIIPVEEWWAAAMCYFFTGEGEVAEGWGLFIGLNRYDGSPFARVRIGRRSYSVPDMKYAVADAHAMALALSDTFSNQRVLTDGQATSGAIENAITDFLGEASEGATVMIYYAGVGARVAEEGLAPEEAMPALVSYDCELITATTVGQWLQGLKAQNVLLILDTSHGGTRDWATRTFYYRAEFEELFPPLESNFGDALAHATASGLVPEPVFPGNVLVLTAAQPDQVTHEDSEYGHGVFTYHLLEGLRGEAEQDGDGFVTIQELHSYVLSELEERHALHPELHDPDQVPVVLTELR